MKIKENIAISDSGFMFDPNSGDSFSLNKTGKEILALMKESKTENEIKNIFLEKYELDSATFDHNYYDFIEMLKAYNIVMDNQF